MNSVGAVTPIDLSGVYKVDGLDTWDNFVIDAEGVLHRYALSASKGLGQKRHLQAALRHAVSTDDGLNWQDLDVVLEASRDGRWPDLVIWGSNGVYRDVPGGGKEFLLFVTGRSKADGELQRIGLAKSSNGHDFSRPKVVLDPTSRMGYDITDDDGIIMAWRDPFVFRDHDDRWHMLFAAKAARPAGPPIATVGHAIAKDDDLEQWELQPPLQLPRHYRQLEVPSLAQAPAGITCSSPPRTGQRRPTMRPSRRRFAATWHLRCSAPGSSSMARRTSSTATRSTPRSSSSADRARRSTPRWPSSPRTPRSPSPPRPSSISNGRWTSTWGGRGPSLTLKWSSGFFEGAAA